MEYGVRRVYPVATSSSAQSDGQKEYAQECGDPREWRGRKKTSSENLQDDAIADAGAGGAAVYGVETQDARVSRGNVGRFFEATIVLGGCRFGIQSSADSLFYSDF